MLSINENNVSDCIVCLLIIFIILLIFCESNIDNFTSIFSSREKVCIAGGECYEVCKEFENKDKAAELLNHLNLMNVAVLRHVRSTRGVASPRFQKKVDALLKRYNPQVMMENTPHNNDSPRTTSYTTNKGENMMICVRSLETDALEDISVLEFVVLHELAHVATEIWGHEVPFWVTFKWVLQQAKDAGIHEPVNYSLKPVRYCGMNINYNPFFDGTVEDLK